MNENQDKVWYSRGVTLNKGNYESERIDVGIALTVPATAAQGEHHANNMRKLCWEDARDFVEAKLSELMAEATGAEPEPVRKPRSKKKAGKKAKKRRPPPDHFDDQDALRRDAAQERAIARVNLKYVDDFESDHGPELQPEDLDNDDPLSEAHERRKMKVVKRAIKNQRYRYGLPAFDPRDAGIGLDEDDVDPLRYGKD